MDHEELQQRLLEYGISREELAAEVGVTPRAVGWWLSGGRRLPTDQVRAAMERLEAKRIGYRQGREDAAKAAHTAILEY